MKTYIDISKFSLAAGHWDFKKSKSTCDFSFFFFFNFLT